MSTQSEYLDVRAVMEHLGVKRDTAYRIMRKVGVVDLGISGIRKLLVRRSELETWLDEHKVRSF